MYRKLVLTIVLILVSVVMIYPQELVLKTHGVSPAMVEKDTLGNPGYLGIYDRITTGLENVGVESKVYLIATFEDSFLTAVSWNLFEKPGGSGASLSAATEVDSESEVVSFIADEVGTYKIGITEGAMGDTIVINASMFVSVENCDNCHNGAFLPDKITPWSGTGHSTMLDRGLDGTHGDYYGESCISCHTVGWDTLATNGGFDDYMERYGYEGGFVFPDTLFVGMADSMYKTYPEAMRLANIQCESCHGPGNDHMGDTRDSKVVASMSVDVCASCHDAGTHHVFVEQWRHSGEDATEITGEGFDGGHAKGAFVSRGTRAGCAACHSGAGFVQWVNEGRPVDEYGLPAEISTVPDATKHTCATCHDPHDATNEHQLRFADTQLGDGTPVTIEKYGAGALCMQCHRSRRNAVTYTEDPDNASSHYGAHHGPEADLLLAANYPDFKDEDGKSIEFPTSPHAVAVLPGHDQGDACVNCHMAGEDKVDAEGNIILVGGHSWNMNDAEGNDNVEACAPCHGYIGETFDSKKFYFNGNADHDGNGIEEGLQLEVKGLMEKLALLLPPVGEIDVSLTDTSLAPEVFKAGYVYFWVEEDRSLGVHNPAFTVALLKEAIKNVGGITSIDFPESSLPNVYKLSQNYPNPFNPVTMIEFSIKEAGNVKLVIYDVLGKEVQTLVNEEMAAGSYKAQFDGAALASGIYFYRIEAGTFTDLKKMMLLK